MFLLQNTIQHYAWGSRTQLAQLMGRPAPGLPEAELWIGAHPKSPSLVPGGRSLEQVIASAPNRLLGERCLQKVGRELPFLLKVLAVEQPLSLQAHPNLEQARSGFAREQVEGVDLNAPERTYKDGNHKPELLCALTQFEALCGFREPSATATLFEELELGDATWVQGLRAGGPAALRATFSRVMSLSGDRKTALLTQVVSRARRLANADGPFQKSYAWVARLAEAYPGDVGALGSLLLNYVCLAPGEAIFVGAGQLHSYLRGLGVELMANSDNVLRGGLTQKHVDVPELLRILRFESQSLAPLLAREDEAGFCTYPTAATEFELSRLTLEGAPVTTDTVGPSLWLCTNGRAQIHADVHSPLPLGPGDAAFVGADAGVLRLQGSAVLFRARVPGL